MTPAELDLVRLKCRVMVLEDVLYSAVQGLVRSGALSPAVLEAAFVRWRERAATVSMPGLPPEQSDLFAGEYQDALAHLIDHLRNAMK